MDTVYNPKWVSNTTKCPTLSITGTSKVVYPHASGFTQGSNLEGTGGFLTSEEGHRGSQLHSSEERVLQQTFSGEEKIRGVETCHRPVSTQPVHSVSTLQDGNCGFHQTSTSKRGLGNIIGFNRCLLPCDDSPEIQKVSSVLFRRENISVPGTTVRSLCKSLCVFQSLKSGLEAYPSPRYSGARISGRLDSTFCVRGSVMASQQKVIVNRFRPRFSPQLGQIRTDPSSGFQFPRGPFQPRPSLSQPISRPSGFVPTSNDKAVGCQGGFSSPVTFPLRTDGIYGQPINSRESIQEMPAMGTQGEMVSEFGSVGQQNCVRSLVLQCRQALDRHRLSEVYVSSSPSCSSASPLYRFQPRGLGSSHGGTYGIRVLVSSMEDPAHQCSRDAGSMASSSSLCRLYQRQFNFAVHRQYDSGSLFESTGRDPLSVSMQYGSGNYVMVCQEQGSHKGQIPARETQCSGRLSEQERECSSDRMVSQSEGSRSSVSALGNPPYRSVRYSSEQEGTNFCISSSRPSSSCIRRPVSELEGDVGIRLPSFSPDSYHAEESARGRVSSLSDSSSMGRTGMVSSASVSSGGSTDPAPSEEGSFVSTGVQVVTPNTSDISSSRLVAMQQHMEASGISRSVARRIYSAKRSSTNALYDYRWKSWVDWCVGREVDPFNPSVNQFGEFLIFLHNKNFSPATVKGYRSAISTTLKQISKIDFSCESILSDVVRSFELERPRTKVHFPKWDLAIVLAALSNAPFEPLEECGFKELTLKTVFLTALASGRRRSEIHALVCSDIEFSEHSVTLGTFPGFLAKNQLPSVLASPIVIPVLKGQDVNTSLCPVRALRIYFNRVFPRRKGRKRLFISHQDSYEKEISVDSISRWIVQTIKLAHSANNVDQVPVSVNAHEVRAIASSWAWSNKVPLDDVVKAGFWSSENSFIRFYLRDTSVLASSLGLIGPVVAAQAVVVPATTM